MHTHTQIKENNGQQEEHYCHHSRDDVCLTIPGDTLGHHSVVLVDNSLLKSQHLPFPIWLLVPTPDSLFPTLLPDNGLGKAAEDGQVFGPLPILQKTQVSLLPPWFHPTLATVAMWLVSELKDLSLCITCRTPSK